MFVGFDGSRTQDTTAFVCTDMTGFQWIPYLWSGLPHRVEVPVQEVEEAWRTSTASSAYAVRCGPALVEVERRGGGDVER